MSADTMLEFFRGTKWTRIIVKRLPEDWLAFVAVGEGGERYDGWMQASADVTTFCVWLRAELCCEVVLWYGRRRVKVVNGERVGVVSIRFEFKPFVEFRGAC